MLKYGYIYPKIFTRGIKVSRKQPTNDSNVHKGHRIRLKELYKKAGKDALPPHVLLELLLFFGIPYKDTNETAHQLINKFGSLKNVFEADLQELKSVKNMTENAALLIHLTADIGKMYGKGQAETADTPKGPEEIKDYILRKYADVKTEIPFLLLLDKDNRLISGCFLNEGSENSSGVNVGKIVKLANTANSTSVIIAHNHPDGTGISSNDIVSTRNLAFYLNGVGIRLAESFIVSKDKIYSIPEIMRGDSGKEAFVPPHIPPTEKDNTP